MKSLPKYTIAIINEALDNLFNRLRARFLNRNFGPKQVAIFIDKRPELSLPGLFNDSSEAEGMAPNQGILDTLEKVTQGYIDSYQELARAKVLNAVQAAIHNAENKTLDFETFLGGELSDVFKTVNNNVKRLVETESTTARNVGAVDSILKVNTYLGIEDPCVVFLGVLDAETCEECKKLHWLPDGTPKVWKMSEVSHSYHKKGENFPSVSGAHPSCRCSCASILPGYGFKGGKLAFISLDHDEYKKQRE